MCVYYYPYVYEGDLEIQRCQQHIKRESIKNSSQGMSLE